MFHVMHTHSDVSSHRMSSKVGQGPGHWMESQTLKTPAGFPVPTIPSSRTLGRKCVTLGKRTRKREEGEGVREGETVGKGGSKIREERRTRGKRRRALVDKIITKQAYTHIQILQIEIDTVETLYQSQRKLMSTVVTFLSNSPSNHLLKVDFSRMFQPFKHQCVGEGNRSERKGQRWEAEQEHHKRWEQEGWNKPKYKEEERIQSFVKEMFCCLYVLFMITSYLLCV